MKSEEQNFIQNSSLKTPILAERERKGKHGFPLHPISALAHNDGLLASNQMLAMVCSQSYAEILYYHSPFSFETLRKAQASLKSLTYDASLRCWKQ